MKPIIIAPRHSASLAIASTLALSRDCPVIAMPQEPKFDMAKLVEQHTVKWQREPEAFPKQKRPKKRVKKWRF